eukprot:1139088-Pelagomonas_calceolata.AAC.1
MEYGVLSSMFVKKSAWKGERKSSWHGQKDTVQQVGSLALVQGLTNGPVAVCIAETCGKGAQESTEI